MWLLFQKEIIGKNNNNNKKTNNTKPTKQNQERGYRTQLLVWTIIAMEINTLQSVNDMSHRCVSSSTDDTQNKSEFVYK